MIVFPEHCKRCKYYGYGVCDYAYKTGKSRLKEYGVDDSLSLDDRINDLNNRCTHWITTAELKTYQTENRESGKNSKTDYREEFVELYKTGMTDLQIAEKLGKTKDAVRKARYRMGLPRND